MLLGNNPGASKAFPAVLEAPGAIKDLEEAIGEFSFGFEFSGQVSQVDLKKEGCKPVAGLAFRPAPVGR